MKSKYIKLALVTSLTLGACDNAPFSADRAAAEKELAIAIAQIRWNGSRIIPIANGYFGYGIVGGRDLDKAIKLDPTYSEAYYQRGLSFEAAKEWSMAVADYTKALELLPPDVPKLPTDLERKLGTGELPPVYGEMRRYREELQDRIKQLRSN